VNKLRCTGKTGLKSILMRTEQSMIFKIRQDVIGNKLFHGFYNQRSERNRSIISDKFFLAFFIYWSNLGTLDMLNRYE